MSAFSKCLIQLLWVLRISLPISIFHLLQVCLFWPSIWNNDQVRANPAGRCQDVSVEVFHQSWPGLTRGWAGNWLLHQENYARCGRRQQVGGSTRSTPSHRLPITHTHLIPMINIHWSEESLESNRKLVERYSHHTTPAARWFLRIGFSFLSIKSVNCQRQAS